MTFDDIVLAANPKASQKDVEEIVWTRTAFPFERLAVKPLYKEAARYFRAKKNGIRLCDFCNNVAMTGDIVCEKCDSLLKIGALVDR